MYSIGYIYIYIYTAVIQQGIYSAYRGILQALPYFARHLLKVCRKGAFCKVFCRLLSFIPHFFHRNPLLNKLQDLGLRLISPI